MYCQDPKNQEPWKAMGNPDHRESYSVVLGESHNCPLSLNYRTLTFWEYKLCWLGVAANKACPLYSHARMDGDHLLQCTKLNDYTIDGIVTRYWVGRRQMVKK
ncbi:hypothetical protein TNCV_3010841 [Trichonephila clavipes]|nr:hypothetical protein TNCV_3010841 [Trichonephila clavipes]